MKNNADQIDSGADTTTVKSPCIAVCMLNADDICEGCYRSSQEITDWSVLSNAQKRTVMVEVRARFQRLNTHQLL